MRQYLPPASFFTVQIHIGGVNGRVSGGVSGAVSGGASDLARGEREEDWCAFFPVTSVSGAWFMCVYVYVCMLYVRMYSCVLFSLYMCDSDDDEHAGHVDGTSQFRK